MVGHLCVPVLGVVMKYKVILKRGKHFKDVVWEHDKVWDAVDRAWVLANLHSATPYEFNPDTGIFTVDASPYYDRKEPK